MKGSGSGEGGWYDRKAAAWFTKRDSFGASIATVTLRELKSKLTARIQGLGVSEVLIWEFLATHQTVAEDNAFRHLSFDERMKQFRSKAA